MVRQTTGSATALAVALTSLLGTDLRGLLRVSTTPQSSSGKSMKNIAPKSRLRRWLTLLLPGVAGMAACERPNYTYSDDVQVVGTGASTSFAGTGFTSAGTSIGTAGAIPLDPCALDRTVSNAPIFAKQAVSNQLPVRPELYAQMTDAEVAALKKGGSLIPPAAPLPALSSLTSVLNAASTTATPERRELITKLLPRFKSTRTLWPNPWALRLIDHPGTEHMNIVRVVLNKAAWVVRIFDGTPPTVVDVNNGIVSVDDANAHPERIAAIYYVFDDRAPGNSAAQCESGKRELALGNEAMVDEFSIGTPEILERLNSDIEALTAFFSVVRPCASVERGAGTFHAYTVCQSWRFFSASTEYSAYQWALANPMELYKPKTQNLATLIDALKDDRFEPDPFVGTPPDVVPVGGAGGTGGAGGASDGGAAGAGGATDGGNSF